MRILAPVLLLCLLPLLPSCADFTWQGRGAGITDDQRARSIQDVDSLARDYQTRKYYRDLKRRRSGRSNAFGRGLEQISATIDRHFFNYSMDDPYVNFESDLTMPDHLLRFFGTSIAR